MAALVPLLTSVIVAVSCSSSGEGKGSAGGVASCCFADPDPHAVSLVGCDASSACPQGTVCSSSYDPCVGDPCRPALAGCMPDTADREAGAPWCKVASRVSGPDPILLDSSVLITGFDVNGFDIFPADNMTNGSAAAFEWHLPDEALLVTCALFGDLPDVGPINDTSDQGTDDAPPSRWIRNYDHAVLSQQVFTMMGASFSLATLTGPLPADGGPVAEPVAACTAASSQGHAKRTRINMLAVGCWAYDETKLVAATPLLRVKSTDLPADNRVVVPSGGACSEDGMSCAYPIGADEEAFGDCVDGACLARCVVDADCNPPNDADAGSGCATADPVLRCRWNAPDEYIGFCSDAGGAGGGACR